MGRCLRDPEWSYDGKSLDITLALSVVSKTIREGTFLFLISSPLLYYNHPIVKIRKLLIHLLYSLPFVFVFIASLSRPNDPDLGWHLKYGQYFFEHFSPVRSNPFSTDMSNYHWVNVSWGIDLITYSIFRMGGFLSLTLACAGVITGIFYFFSKAFRLGFFEQTLIFPIIMYLETNLFDVSFRGQLVSIMFLGILALIYTRYEEGTKKLLFLVPAFFWFWANIHGQFFLGLGVFFLWGLSYLTQIYFIEKDPKKAFSEGKFISLISIISVGLTMINPFGIHLYLETIKYVSNPLLFAITEYLPAEQLSTVWWNHILTGFFIIIGVLAVFFSGEWKKKVSSLSIFSFLYLMSFTIKRYSWSMYFFTIPLIKPVALFLKPDKKRHENLLGGIIVICSIIVVLILKSPLGQYSDMSWDIFCNQYYGCSTEAAHILEGMETGRLMNLYAWGGWLMWEHPDVRISIDGRMHLWRDEKGFSAYKTYYDYEQNVTDVDTSTYQTAYVPNNKPVYNRLMELSFEGKWKLIFRDNNGAIFVRQ